MVQFEDSYSKTNLEPLEQAESFSQNDPILNIEEIKLDQHRGMDRHRGNANSEQVRHRELNG